MPSTMTDLLPLSQWETMSCCIMKGYLKHLNDAVLLINKKLLRVFYILLAALCADRSSIVHRFATEHVTLTLDAIHVCIC